MKWRTIIACIALALSYSPYCEAQTPIPWPISECGRQGIFQILGQPQTCMDTLGFAFHDAVDIVANDATGANISIVRCVHSGWLFLLNYGQYDRKPWTWLSFVPGTVYDTSEIWILLDTGETTRCEENTFDVYGHVVPNDDVIEKWAENISALNGGVQDFFKFRRIEAGEIIGYVSKPGETGYGSNAASHLHFARFEGDRIGSCAWERWQNKILSNPLNLFENGVSQDTTDPIFLNFSETDPEWGYPIDLVDDSKNFGIPYALWHQYIDSEGDPLNRYDNIDKNKCPWRIRGKIDVWVKAIDFMNAKGAFDEKWTKPFDGFDIHPVVNKIQYDIKDSADNSIFSQTQLLIDFNNYIPGKLHGTLTAAYNSVFAPWWDELLGEYRGYPMPNVYVVTNTDGTGNPQTSGCWDTTTIPNGIYTIEVTVSDLNNNSATITMAVEVLNADIYVDADNYPGGTGTLHDPFGTITQAVYSASNNDIIFIHPGTYNSGEAFPLEIDQIGVTIIGAGAEDTTVQGNFNSSIFVIKRCDVTIDDLTITGADYVVEPNFGAIVIDNVCGTIKNCMINFNDCPGICLHYSYVETLVSNCIIQNNSPCGIYSDHAHNPTNIVNCTIINNGVAGIAPEYNSFTHISNCNLIGHTEAGVRSIHNSLTWLFYCNFYNNPYHWRDDGTGQVFSGNLSSHNPGFVSSGGRPYYLNSDADPGMDSLCIDAGSDVYVEDPDVYNRTTRTDNYQFSSGIYDDYPADIGFHYPPVCQTAIPTPIPTPAPVDTCLPTPVPDPNEGVLDVVKDPLNDLWTIQLSDPNCTSPPYPEVHIASEADPTGFSMSLLSTKARDEFEEILGFVLAPTPSDPINRLLSVNDPDWVTINYEDDSPVVMVTHETGYSYGTPLPSATPTPTTGPWTDTDAFGYTGTAPAVYSWIDATGGTNTGVTDDDGYSDVSIPFDFRFYGHLYNSARVSANGFLTFGDNGWAFANSGLPWQEDPNEGIYPLWDDLDPSQGGSIYTITTGAMPNRQFIVQWHQIPFRNSLDTVMFEVVLFESTNAILFQYDEMNGSLGTGISASVGIENSSGTVGLRYSSRFTAGTVYDGLAIQFVPPVSTPTPIATATPCSGSYAEDFESGGEYWTANGLWYLSNDATSNCPPTPNSHSPGKSWHYGRDDACNYETGDRNWGELVSPLIDLSGTAYLSFYSWSDVEPSAGNSLDVRTVFVSTDDGLNWEYRGQITGDEADWVEQGVLLGYIANPAKIKFRFDTVDAENNDFRGWYIDDLSIVIFTPTPTPLPIPATSPGGNILTILGISILLIVLTLTRKISME